MWKFDEGCDELTMRSEQNLMEKKCIQTLYRSLSDSARNLWRRDTADPRKSGVVHASGTVALTQTIKYPVATER